MADALKIGHIEAQIATETIIPQIGWNTYLKLSFFPEHKHFMTIQSWFCYFELFRVYSFSPTLMGTVSYIPLDSFAAQREQDL